MSVYEFGPFRLDVERLLLLEAGEPVAIGPKVVETLLALIEHPGDVMTKAALLDRVWPEGFVDEANLAQNVYVLRKLFRAHGIAAAIETVPRRGYRFTADVRRIEHVASSQPTIVAEPAAPRARWWQPVAAALVAAVLAGGMLAAFAPHRASARPGLSPAGQRYYEIGRYYWNLRTDTGLRESVAYFKRVIDTDPKDARGYAALASANALLGDYQYGPSPAKVYFARARAYAHKALAIDSSSGDAYAVLGMLETEGMSPSSKRLFQGLAMLRHAVTLDPSDAPAHEWYGISLLSAGQFSQGYAELQKSAQLDPLSVATTLWLGDAAYLTHRYEAAIGYARDAVDFSPLGREALGTMGLAYEARGDVGKAIATFQRLARACDHCRYEAAALLAQAYARSNRLPEARHEARIAGRRPSEVAPQDLAAAWLAIGDRHTAYLWLRRLPRELLRAQVASDPRFGSLRTDPEIAQLDQKPA